MIRGEGGMSSTRKEESKSALQILNKSSQSKTSVPCSHLIFDINVKKRNEQKRKENSFVFPTRRGRCREECWMNARRERAESINQPTALLPSRNTSIAPRYILPNARTNIHPALIITARSSVPLLLLLFFLLDVYQNQMCLIHCCKAGNSYLNSRYHLT